MTAVFESLLNNTFTISRNSPVSDGQGGWIDAWVEMGTVAGRMRPASSSEIDVARQQQREITHVLYVTADTDLARGDLVEGGGITVEVQGVREPSLAGHHLEVDCRERQQGQETELSS